MPQNQNYYDHRTNRLRQDIADGLIVTIVGAGASMAATGGETIASWNGLLEDGIQYCLSCVPDTDEAWATRQRSLLRDGEVAEIVSAARHVEDKLRTARSGLFYAWLKGTVGKLTVADPTLGNSLKGLPTRLLTTNYDLLLEDVSGLRPITWGQGDRVEEFFRKKEDGVLHIHGRWDEPEGVVLGVNYDRIVAHEAVQAQIRGLLVQYRFLFVGVGAGIRDPHFSALMAWSQRIFPDSNYSHYFLAKRDDLEGLEKSPHFGTHLVALPYGENHADLAGFIDSLIPAKTTLLTAVTSMPTEYQLVIQCDQVNVDEIDRDALQNKLRELARDMSLVLERIEHGSVRLFVRSSEEARATLISLAEDGTLVRYVLEAQRINRSDDSSVLFWEISEKFRGPSLGLINWPQTLRSGEWLDRPELAQLLTTLDENDSSTTVVLGGPGTGKSALLSRLAEEALHRGFAVVACKADFLPTAVKSLEELQHLWGLPLTVDDSIRYLCSSKKTVLLIDQLDALADLLDVKSDRLNVLLELINGLAGHAHLHIVTSSRQFEFAHDVRLSTLDASPLSLELPAWDQVTEVLALHDLDANDWPETLREILRVPQHLKIMLAHFCDSKDSQAFVSYHHMLEALWEKCVTPWSDRSELIDAIASEMATEEALWVPKVRYDSKFFQPIQKLIAADVLKIHDVGPRIGFTHQTLFSFARARAFARGQEKLAEYVLARQGRLFVRPTLWNALFYLRSADEAEYSRQFVELWESSTLRAHIRFLLVDFLGQVPDPLECEIEAVNSTLARKELVPRLLTSLSGKERWVDVIAGTLPELMHLSPDESWPVANFLRAALPFAPTDVLRLVETEWFPRPERDAAVWRVLEPPLSEWREESQHMIVEILRRTEVAPFYVAHLAKEVAALSAESAFQLIRVRFDNNLNRALKNVPVPYEPSGRAETEMEELVERVSHRDLQPLENLLEQNQEWHELSDIAEKYPEPFLQELWAWYLRILGHLAREVRPDVVRYSDTQSLATALRHDEHLATVYVVPHAYDLAVKKLAEQDPEIFMEFTERNSSENILLVQRMIARGLSRIAGSHPRACLDFLLEDERRLTLGDFQNVHKDSIALINAISPHLQREEIERLASYIRSFELYLHREDDDAVTRRNTNRQNREHRLRLLNAIPEQCLTPDIAAHIASERIALPNYREWDTFSSGMMRVDSPMSSEQMRNAKNEDIVGLFNELGDNTEWNHPRHPMRGGSIQASREFADFAKGEPERAIVILDSLAPQEHEVPVGQALISLAEGGLNPGRLYELIRNLWDRGFVAESFREDAARAVRVSLNSEVHLPEEMCLLLESWLNLPWRRPIDVEENVSPFEEAAADLGSVLWHTGGFEMIPHGTFQVLDTLTYDYLHRLPRLTERWITLLENHLNQRDRVEVWRTLTHWLVNLKLCDRSRATAFLNRLFDLYPGVLCSRNAAILLAQARWWLSDNAVDPWLETIRDSEWLLGPQVFGEIEFLRRGSNGDDSTPFYSKYTNEPSPSTRIKGIQKGIAYAAAHLWKDGEYRAAATDVLLRLLPSEDMSIATAVLDVFVTAEALPNDQYTVRLLDGMCTHHVFGHDTRSTYWLKHLAHLVRAQHLLVARVVECFIDEAASDLADFRTAFFGSASELADIALTLQRYEDTHEQGLQIFERLLELNAYGAQDILNELDQIPKNAFARGRSRRT